MSASTAFRIESIPTFRAINGRFAVAEKELLEARRDEMRVLGAKARDIYQEEAPKKTGEFSRNIRYRTFVRSDSVGFTVSMPQPLGKWITDGTRPHVIRPRGQGYPLRFTVNGRTVYAYRVNHPGTKPNPFTERAAARFEPEGQKALNRISLRYIAKVTGK